MTLEKDIEKALTNLVEKYGGRCLKWVCPGWIGVPDRIVLIPRGHILFAETKRPNGGRLASMQGWWRRELTKLGFLSCLVKDEESLRGVEKVLQTWTGRSVG